MAAALRFDDAILDLIAHAEPVPAADRVGFEKHVERGRERRAIERDRMALLEADTDRLTRHRHVVFPERHAHDRLDDGHALVEQFQIFGFVGRAENIRVG